MDTRAAIPVRYQQIRSLIYYRNIYNSDRIVILLALSGAIVLATSLPSLKLSVALVMGAILLVAVLLRPAIGLYSLAVSAPFGSGIEVSVGPFLVSVTDALVGLTVLAWIGYLSILRSARIHFPPLILPIILLLCALLLSLSNAISVSLGLKEIIKWLEVAAVLLMSSNILNSTNTRLGLIITMLMAAAVEAALGLVQSRFGLGPAGFLLGNDVLRAYGSFGQPNPYAGYLVASAAFGIGLAVGAMGIPKWKHWLIGAAAISLPVTITLAGAAASLSRGAALAFVAASGVCSLRDYRTIAAVLIVTLSALTLMYSGIAIPLPELLASRLDITLEYFRLFDARTVQVTPENWPVVHRMALWQSAWYMFLSSPISGVGAGNFDAAYPYFALPDWISFPLGHAHNYYLNLLAETGILGLISYTVLVLSIFIYCLRALFSYKDKSDLGIKGLWTSPPAIAWGVMASITALSVHNIFDNLYVHGIPIFVALLMGLLSSVMMGRSHS